MSRTWYGSFQNRVAERMVGPEPKIGMGVTEYCYSDRHPYEVIAIKDERHITVRAMGYRLPAGCEGGIGNEDWEVYSDPEGRVTNLFRKKNGRWVEKIGRSEGCNTFGLGVAQYHYDWSF